MSAPLATMSLKMGHEFVIDASFNLRKGAVSRRARPVEICKWWQYHPSYA